MSDQKQHMKISLEDLLRLKRAERPDTQFWVKFDASLRHKQLSAIIQPRSRWPFFRLLAQKRSYFLASAGVGALAVFAVTVSLRHPAGGQVRDTQSSVANAGILTVVAPPSSVVALLAAKPAVLDQVVASHALPIEAASVAVAARSEVTSQSIPEKTLHAQVVVEVVQVSSRPNDATNLFQSTSLVSGGFSSADVAIPSVAAPEVDISVSTKAEPAFTVVSVSDSRKARLLASVEQTSTNGRSLNNPRLARGRERIGSNISDESIYDSIHRLGLNGDRLSIRF